MFLAMTLMIAGTSPCFLPLDAFSPMVMPADGATDVPTNATPIVHGVFSAALPELVIDGVPAAAHVDTFETLDGFGKRPWLRIIPDAELPAGALVAEVFDGEPAASFTVGDASDVEPPAAPTVAFVGPYADGACVPYVEVSVEGDVASIARIGDAPSLADGSVVHGLGTDGSVVVGGEADAKERVLVSAVDLAGNVSEPAFVDVTFPPELTFPGGCSAMGAEPSLPTFTALAVLSFVWRRSRGRGRVSA